MYVLAKEQGDAVSLRGTPSAKVTGQIDYIGLSHTADKTPSSRLLFDQGREVSPLNATF